METRRDNQSSEGRHESKRDVQRTPETQHEVQRSGRDRGELTRRGGMDIARDPFTMMSALRREIDRLFDDFSFGGSLFRSPRLFDDLGRSFEEMGRSVWSPQVEVTERDGKLHVSADLPGLSKDDVRIEVLENTLTIEGERRSEQRDERGGWNERSYGRFFRSIPLPEGINPDTAQANFENGVLEITFDAPKREQRRGRQIQIGSGSKR